MFHKPLAPHEVAGHVGVSVVDERTQTQGDQFQVHVLNGWVQVAVLTPDDIAINKRKGSESIAIVVNLFRTSDRIDSGRTDIKICYINKFMPPHDENSYLLHVSRLNI